MTAPNEIQLGVTGNMAILSANGRTLTLGWEDGLVREERAASGKLRRDVITRKRWAKIDYSVADQATVDRLEYLDGLNTALTAKITHLTTTTTYTVLMSPISRERLLAVNGGLWAGLTLTLREV
jgi:hypothetical protein